jgi:cytosine/adenosine deaminase-related metal-dependent hydrolase
MVLNNIILINHRDPVNISVKGRHIGTVSANETSLLADELQFDFEDAIAFPGLINSHDHLDFNCFSPLGKKVYKNYAEWGNHIHETYKNDINEVLKIPLQLRSTWGMYKNLLAGVTTVVNHGPVLKIEYPLISIRQEIQSLHSVKFQRNWKWKLNNPFLRKKVCVIHTGEGSDIGSSKEIDELLRWNLWNRKLIGVHGVAMNPQQAKKFIGLVWCPVSNRFLLNKDASVARLKENIRLVFGTDSTLTGNWNVWQHLRLARMTKQVSDTELFEMVTKSPARLWNCHSGEIRHGKRADIVIAKKKEGIAGWDRFFETDPEDILMVIHKGKIRVFDQQFFLQLKERNFDVSNYFPITINGSVKFVEGDLPELMASIKYYYPKAVFPCEVYEEAKITVDD